jgi:hypothetical protein
MRNCDRVPEEIDKKGKTLPVRGRGGPWGCETSRLPHFLDNRFTNAREVVSRTCRPPFTPWKMLATHFCYRLSRFQGHSAAGRAGSIENPNDLIGNRTRDLPTCSIVSQQTPLPWNSWILSVILDGGKSNLNVNL